MRTLFGIIMFWGLLLSSSAFACPCGCGTIAIGTLEPGQKTKFISSASYESQVVSVTPSGSVMDDYFYDRTGRFDLVATQALAARTMVTATFGAYKNFKDERSSETLVSDPSVTLSYVLLQQDFTQPWIPRLDAHLSYKHPAAKSFEDAAEKPTAESYLEVGGNGLQEVALGTQAWFGMHEWKFGTSLRYVAFPEVWNESKQGPEHGGKVAIQMSKTFLAKGGVTLESGMEWLGNAKGVDGEVLAGSSRRMDHTSLSASYVLHTFHSMGVSVTRKNLFRLTRNAAGGQTIALSYQAVLL